MQQQTCSSTTEECRGHLVHSYNRLINLAVIEKRPYSVSQPKRPDCNVEHEEYSRYPGAIDRSWNPFAQDFLLPTGPAGRRMSESS